MCQWCGRRDGGAERGVTDSMRGEGRPENSGESMEKKCDATKKLISILTLRGRWAVPNRKRESLS